MHTLKPLFLLVLICSFVTAPMTAYGEAVDDKFTQISPKNNPGGGEFIHGAGYGKLMMRILMFGATQQGIHYFPEGTDLMFAVLYSGGKSELTKLNGIKIRRRDIRDMIDVDLEDLLEDGKPIPKLIDGDIIYVPYNWKKDYQSLFFYMSVVTSLGTLALSIVALASLRTR